MKAYHTSGGERPEDPFERWSRNPTFDFLEQTPAWQDIVPLLVYAAIAAGTGVLFAYLHDTGLALLRKPAKITWSLSLLLLASAGALGLPRVFKFGALCVLSGVVVPLALMFGSIYVYSREPARPTAAPDTGAKHQGAAAVESKAEELAEVEKAKVPEVDHIRP